MAKNEYYKGKFSIVFYGADDYVAFMADNITDVCIIMNIEVTEEALHKMTSRISMALKRKNNIIFDKEKYKVKLYNNER